MGGDRADCVAVAPPDTSRSAGRKAILPNRANGAVRNLCWAWPPAQFQEVEHGGGAVWAPPRSVRSGPRSRGPLSALRLDLESLVHVRRDVAESVRLHHLELHLEQARCIVVLIGPLEPDWHGQALKLRQVLGRHADDLRSCLFEFAPRFEVGF